MQFRHGDVLLEKLPGDLPEGLVKGRVPILAHGEVTGHCHRIADPSAATIYSVPFDATYGALRGEAILEVTAETADLVHEEHKTIKLPRGLYRVWRQREYTPQSIRTIRD